MWEIISMRRYGKVCLLSVLGASLLALLPWGLAYFGIFPMALALDRLSVPFAAAGLLLPSYYVVRRVESKKYRWIILLLNPVLYYLAGLIGLKIMLAAETWHGFHLAP